MSSSIRNHSPIVQATRRMQDCSLNARLTCCTSGVTRRLADSKEPLHILDGTHVCYLFRGTVFVDSSLRAMLIRLPAQIVPQGTCWGAPSAGLVARTPSRTPTRTPFGVAQPSWCVAVGLQAAEQCEACCVLRLDLLTHRYTSLCTIARPIAGHAPVVIKNMNAEVHRRKLHKLKVEMVKGAGCG